METSCFIFVTSYTLDSFRNCAAFVRSGEIYWSLCTTMAKAEFASLWFVGDPRRCSEFVSRIPCRNEGWSLLGRMQYPQGSLHIRHRQRKDAKASSHQLPQGGCSARCNGRRDIHRRVHAQHHLRVRMHSISDDPSYNSQWFSWQSNTQYIRVFT